MVTGYGTIEGGINQEAWDGVMTAATDLGLEYEYRESFDPADHERNITDLIDSESSIIVAVGSELTEAVVAAASANPEVYFIGVDQRSDGQLPNVGTLVFPDDITGFLAGALAGILTENEVVGLVIGIDSAENAAFKTGWENGVAYANPDAKTISMSHLGGSNTQFFDLGTQAANDLITQGADVINARHDLAGAGALTATASHDGVYCIGADTDLWVIHPYARPCLVTSVIDLVSTSIVHMIEHAYFEDFNIGEHLGGIGLAPFYDFDAVATQEMRDAISDIYVGLYSETIETGYGPAGSGTS